MSEHKALSEIYSGTRLDMAIEDLAKAADIIDSWLEGESIDPDLLNYMAMMFTSMSRDLPQDIDEDLQDENHSH